MIQIVNAEGKGTGRTNRSVIAWREKKTWSRRPQIARQFQGVERVGRRTGQWDSFEALQSTTNFGGKATNTVRAFPATVDDLHVRNRSNLFKNSNPGESPLVNCLFRVPRHDINVAGRRGGASFAFEQWTGSAFAHFPSFFAQVEITMVWLSKRDAQALRGPQIGKWPPTLNLKRGLECD